MADWADDVLVFWFGLTSLQWFKRDPELDEVVRKRFLDLWDAQRANLPETFLGSAREALAAVILFDQFPRNMFRDHADSFATDHLALTIAKAVIERGQDDQLTADERAFLYMPFQHSEGLADQQRSITLFAALGGAEKLDFARKHHAIIERFGRFPHRNPILGRAPRPDEVAAGDVNPF